MDNRLPAGLRGRVILGKGNDMETQAYEVKKKIELTIHANSYVESHNQTTGGTKVFIDTDDFEIVMDITKKVKENE